MDLKSSDFVLAGRAAISQIGNLLVQYAFSTAGAVIILVVGWFASTLIHRWTLKGLGEIRGFDQTLARFLANVFRYAVLALVIVMVLGQFGVQTASIIAALGAAGLAIGLALQGTLQNIAAGFMLLLLRPFRVGETIETATVSGTVQEIGLFATELTTGDGLYLLAPNATLWNTPVKNFSRLSARRFDVTVTLPLDCDIAHAEKTLLALAGDDKRARKTPPPETGISAMTDTLINLTLSVWFSTSDWGLASKDMARKVKLASDGLRADMNVGASEANAVA